MTKQQVDMSNRKSNIVLNPAILDYHRVNYCTRVSFLFACISNYNTHYNLHNHTYSAADRKPTLAELQTIAVEGKDYHIMMVVAEGYLCDVQLW